MVNNNKIQGRDFYCYLYKKAGIIILSCRCCWRIADNQKMDDVYFGVCSSLHSLSTALASLMKVRFLGWPCRFYFRILRSTYFKTLELQMVVLQGWVCWFIHQTSWSTLPFVVAVPVETKVASFERSGRPDMRIAFELSSISYHVSSLIHSFRLKIMNLFSRIIKCFGNRWPVQHSTRGMSYTASVCYILDMLQC